MHCFLQFSSRSNAAGWLHQLLDPRQNKKIAVMQEQMHPCSKATRPRPRVCWWPLQRCTTTKPQQTMRTPSVLQPRLTQKREALRLQRRPVSRNPLQVLRVQQTLHRQKRAALNKQTRTAQLGLLLSANVAVAPPVAVAAVS